MNRDIVFIEISILVSLLIDVGFAKEAVRHILINPIHSISFKSDLRSKRHFFTVHVRTTFRPTIQSVAYQTGTVTVGIRFLIIQPRKGEHGIFRKKVTSCTILNARHRLSFASMG